jgi:hypothetical protein
MFYALNPNLEIGKQVLKALFNHDIFNQPKRKERLNVESKIGTMKINQTHIKERKGKESWTNAGRNRIHWAIRHRQHSET